MSPTTESAHARASPPRRVLMALGYYDPQLHRGITRYAREAGWVLLLDWHGAAQHDRRLNWFDWLQRELTNMTRKSI